MEEVYRGYRIAIVQDGAWTARITHVRGPLAPVKAQAAAAEGAEVCLTRARAAIDSYLVFLGGREDDD